MPSEIELVSKLMANVDNLKPKRANYDTVFQDISEYVLPNRGDFTKTTTPGERRDKRVFNSTAVQANETLASILHSGLTDSSSRWFNLVPTDKKLVEDEDIQRWVEEVQEIMYSHLVRSESGFGQQNHEFLLDLVSYGTAVMWVAEDIEDGVVFNTRHLAEIYIEENSRGFVDTVYRDFKYTARQAAQEFGEENFGPRMEGYLKKEPHKELDFVHCVMPKKDFERLGGKLDAKLSRFEFISVYISVEDKNVLRQKGFNEFPYLVARWEKVVGETYGRSPAWNSLSDIRMVNVMAEVMIRAAQKQVDPPILMSDDGVVFPLQMFPGGVNIGAVNDDGKELIRPFNTNGNLQISEAMIEKVENKIEAAYFVDQFTQRRGVQPLTATEATFNQENRLRLIGPQTRRVEDEYLSPLINRVFSILQRRGQFPDLPDSVLSQGISVLDLDVEYISPLAFTRRSSQLQAYNRFFASAGTFVETNPETLDNFLVDDIIRDSAVKAGIPMSQLKPTVLRDEERAAKAESAQQQQQMATMMAGAETAATLQKSGISVIPQ